MFYALVTAGVSVLLYVLLKTKGRKVNFPPGPNGIAVFGNALQLDKTRPHQSLHQLSQKYGPVVYVKLLQLNVVVLCTGRVLKKAFSDRNYASVLNDKPKGFFGTYVLWQRKNVLFGPYSDTTFKLKSLLSEALKPSMTLRQRNNDLQKMVDLFHSTKGREFDPADIVKHVIADKIVILLCGEARHGDAELLWGFVDWGNKLLNPSLESLLKKLPCLRYLPGTPGFLYKTVIEKRDVMIARLFEETKMTYDPDRCRGVVDACLARQARDRDTDGTCWLSDDMIKALILDTIGGGLATVSNTILCSLLSLLNNSELMDKMQHEIDRILGYRLPSADDMVHMPVCHSVLLETFRYHSIVPMVVHCCSADNIVFEGYEIPKDTMVWGNIWASHHDDELWGDPWAFRPERFLAKNGKILPADDPHMEFLSPYGVGTRLCVGYKNTTVDIFCSIIAIIQNFTLLPPEKDEMVSDDPRLHMIGAVLQQQKYTCRAVSRCGTKVPEINANRTTIQSKMQDCYKR